MFPRGMTLFHDKNPEGFIVHFMEKASTHSPEEAKQIAQEVLADPRRKAGVPNLLSVFEMPAIYPDCVEAWHNDMDNNQKQIALNEIKVPTLVIAGQKDALVPYSH